MPLVDPTFVTPDAEYGQTHRVRLDRGVYQISWFNGDIDLWGRNAPNTEDDHPDVAGLPNYGVVDSPGQFLARFRAALEADPRPLVVTLTHVPKDPDGGTDGWRWHKWGPYLGGGEPTAEYLAQEDGFADGVWCFHVYANPPRPRDREPVAG